MAVVTNRAYALSPCYFAYETNKLTGRGLASRNRRHPPAGRQRYHIMPPLRRLVNRINHLFKRGEPIITFPGYKPCRCQPPDKIKKYHILATISPNRQGLFKAQKWPYGLFQLCHLAIFGQNGLIGCWPFFIDRQKPIFWESWGHNHVDRWVIFLHVGHGGFTP